MNKFAERGQLDLSQVNKDGLEDWKKEEVARIKQESGIVEMPQPYEKDDIDLSEV